MSQSVNRFISRRHLLVLLIIAILSSSWSSSPRYLRLHDLAGDNAFRIAITDHAIIVKDSVLHYRAASGYLTVTDRSNEATLYYTGYSTSKRKRPVTFVFNGGPGSSSIWLHMGSFGPVRAKISNAGYQSNANTWLNFTDLVFIDPVGTGYSRAGDGTDTRHFYGYYEDIRVIGQFIKTYLTLNKLTDSPVFLTGESYGAARAVGLAAYLNDTLHIKTAGITLLSPALNYQLITFKKGNDAPYPYYLPAYAAAAYYHHRLSHVLESLTPAQLDAKVKAFALNSYQQFLKHGKDEQHVTDTLSYFTGIDMTTLRQLNNRITDKQFTRLLQQDSSLQTGTYDSRYSGASVNTDPSVSQLLEVFPEVFKDYSRGNLCYINNLSYLPAIATPVWHGGPLTADGYLNVMPVLEKLLTENPNLKIHIAGGNYDLATPVATVKHLINELNPQIKKQLTANYYNAGHMLYIDNEANKQWHKDSETFYSNTLACDTK